MENTIEFKENYDKFKNMILELEQEIYKKEYTAIEQKYFSENYEEIRENFIENFRSSVGYEHLCSELIEELRNDISIFLDMHTDLFEQAAEEISGNEIEILEWFLIGKFILVWLFYEYIG